VSTDTRSVQKGDLFFALKGENFDANTFVSQAKSNGAVAAVVSQMVDDLPSVLVPDTTKALATLAAAERLKVDIPVVAITGSNGKTSVKEMLVAILAQSYSVLATQGNLNNHIGVPLTLLGLHAKHQIAMIEMGASHAGEIAYLCQLAKPGFAVINNVGDAHLEGFGSVEGIARAKAEIISGLPASGVAILNREDAWFDSWMELVAERRVVSFGWSDRATVWVQQEDVTSSLLDGQFETVFRLHCLQESIDIHCSLLGEHNVLNSMAAASVAIALGLSLAEISTGLAAVKPVHGRMEPLKGLCGSLIVNDCYNASPNSFKEALKCVLGLKKPVWLVLGDFAELGDSSADIHRTLGELIADTEVLRVFAVGEEMKRAVAAINASSAGSKIQALHFSSKGEMSNKLLEVLTSDVVVLVKGSRSQGLEEVVERLVEKEGVPCC
ncbi:MAG: UDP-N-acetylmuramoyl-tripeptide--D-alanyl-D-alanine ligase, partial [Piscirickettsiaceae bacterium]